MKLTETCYRKSYNEVCHYLTLDKGCFNLENIDRAFEVLKTKYVALKKKDITCNVHDDCYELYLSWTMIDSSKDCNESMFLEEWDIED